MPINPPLTNSAPHQPPPPPSPSTTTPPKSLQPCRDVVSLGQQVLMKSINVHNRLLQYDPPSHPAATLPPPPSLVSQPVAKDPVFDEYPLCLFVGLPNCQRRKKNIHESQQLISRQTFPVLLTTFCVCLKKKCEEKA